MKALMRALVVAVLALLVAILPGCSEPPRGIVVWHSYSGGEEAALKRIAARWKGEPVTLLSVPYEAYLSKLEAAIPRGNGPDVFLSPHNRLGEYLLHHLVAPAGDAFPESDVARYDPVTTDAVTHDGARWGVPLASKCAAMYVDEELLDHAPATMEEIASLKAKLPSGVWPIAYESQSVYYHAAILHAFGGTFFDPARGFAMVGPEAERSVEYVRELTKARIVPEEPSGDLVKQLFAQKKAATAIAGPWLAPDLPKDLRYRVVALPRIEGAGPMRPFLTVEAAFLTPDGAKKAEARAFARGLADDAAADDRAELGAQIVSTRAFWEGSKATPMLRAFRDASANAVPMPVSVAMNPAWTPALEAMRKVLRGDASAHDALAEAKARYDDVMKPPPPAPSRWPVVAVLGALLGLLGIATFKRATAPGFARELRKGAPAYRYLVHAVITILVLVVFPLLAGAATSFFAGAQDDPRFVGLANYVDILTARGKPLLAHGSFYLTLLVTVLWTVINVVFHVGLGLVLGMLLARPWLRLRAVYRVLLILPWAVPSYVTALAWKGMFHRQFGAVNAVLTWLGAEPVSWFSQFSTAFAANVATNVWLGFPFMMVVVMGALTSIPKDVLEAAEVDGATRWQSFRLVTLPLLRPTLLPAVVLGSVWTFNMFNVVYLVSGGEPDGTTDILVSEAYRWAFARNSQLGYAAAYAVIIFGVLALMTRVMDRLGAPKEASA